MMRRLVLLGMLGFTACPSIWVPPPPPPRGTVKGSLLPFNLQEAPSGAVRPEPLRDAEVRQRLSRSIASVLAAQQGVRRAALATPETGDAIPGDVIVRFEETHLPEAAALARVQLPGYRAVHKGYLTGYLHLIGYELLGTRAMRVGETGALARQVAGRSGVRYAEPNARVQAFKTPRDPWYPYQWPYSRMHLPAAWDLTTGSDSTVIAVLDSGIVQHPDLDGRFLPGVDMVEEPFRAGDGDGRDTNPTDPGRDLPRGASSWHGTHVAGTLGAVSDEGHGVAGVTWRGGLLPVRVLGREGGSFSDTIAGIQWAIGRDVPGLPPNPHPAQVINLSLGALASPNQALQEIIDEAVAQKVIIVVAAGNEDSNASDFSPCNQWDVICVGATRFNGRRASYSNYGPAVDVMAIGGELDEDLNGDGAPDGVLSTLLDEYREPTWAFEAGTSVAAPQVAGIVALMKSVNPRLTVFQAKHILGKTADPSSRCVEGCGAGLVDAAAAVREARGLADGSIPAEPPKLGVGSAQLLFNGGVTQQLRVRNLGGGALRVTATSGGPHASALSFPQGSAVSLEDYASGPLTVAVDTEGLADGGYEAWVSLTADNGDSTRVRVLFQVGAAQGREALLAFLYQDALGQWQVEEEGVARVPASNGYAYTLSLPPRTYYALATIDEDGDGELFEEGEREGCWREATSLEPIPLTEDQTVTDVRFALVPGLPAVE